MAASQAAFVWLLLSSASLVAPLVIALRLGPLWVRGSRAPPVQHLGRNWWAAGALVFLFATAVTRVFCDHSRCPEPAAVGLFIVNHAATFLVLAVLAEHLTVTVRAGRLPLAASTAFVLVTVGGLAGLISALSPGTAATAALDILVSLIIVPVAPCMSVARGSANAALALVAGWALVIASIYHAPRSRLPGLAVGLVAGTLLLSSALFPAKSNAALVLRGAWQFLAGIAAGALLLGPRGPPKPVRLEQTQPDEQDQELTAVRFEIGDDAD